VLQDDSRKSGGDDDDDGSDDSDANHAAEQHSYCVNHVPPQGVWVDLKTGVKFMR
jgi:hypothetical protein